MSQANECELIFDSEPANHLSKAQRAAIELLAGGATFRAAAEAAGVSRSTIYRWIDGDPLFRSIWTEFQAEIAHTARARLLGLADSAVTAAAAAVDGGDARIAMTMLNRLGVFKPGGSE
jgi:AcrR family transcriptional regulator